MSRRLTPRALPLRVGIAALLLGLVAGPLRPGVASADLGICRTDPLLQLSDGSVLDLTAAVSDSPADVQRIAYTVRIPTGTGVVGVLYTPGPLGARESLSVVADDAPRTYDAQTLVTTGTPGVAVGATAAVVSPATGPLSWGAASGVAGVPVSIHLSL